MKDKGFEAFKIEAIVGGKKYYRVIVGPFMSRDEALQKRNEINQKSGVTDTMIRIIEPQEKN